MRIHRIADQLVRRGSWEPAPAEWITCLGQVSPGLAHQDLETSEDSKLPLSFSAPMLPYYSSKVFLKTACSSRALFYHMLLSRKFCLHYLCSSTWQAWITPGLTLLADLRGPAPSSFAHRPLIIVVAICWTTNNLLEPSALKPSSVPRASLPLPGRGGYWLSLTIWPHSAKNVIYLIYDKSTLLAISSCHLP